VDKKSDILIFIQIDFTVEMENTLKKNEYELD